MGNVTEVIDPKQQATRYEFDRLSRLTSETKILGQTTQYFYNERNQLERVINPRDQKVEYAYEPWGRLKTSHFYPTAALTGPRDNCTVNPDTGEVRDANGDEIGNLDEYA